MSEIVFFTLNRSVSSYFQLEQKFRDFKVASGTWFIISYIILQIWPTNAGRFNLVT